MHGVLFSGLLCSLVCSANICATRLVQATMRVILFLGFDVLAGGQCKHVHHRKLKATMCGSLFCWVCGARLWAAQMFAAQDGVLSDASNHT